MKFIMMIVQTSYNIRFTNDHDCRFSMLILMNEQKADEMLYIHKRFLTKESYNVLVDKRYQTKSFLILILHFNESDLNNDQMDAIIVNFI